MAYVELQYEGKEPCCRCVHKKICEATRSLDEIRYTVRHLKYPLFNINVECTEFYNEEGSDKKFSDFIDADVLGKIMAEITDWQTDIHDNENDAEIHDFIFERIYEILDKYKSESEDKE